MPARKRRIGRSADSLRGVRWITRCAWCRRYRFGDSWLDLSEFDALTEKGRLTHTVCEDCFGKIEADRMRSHG